MDLALHLCRFQLVRALLPGMAQLVPLHSVVQAAKMEEPVLEALVKRFAIVPLDGKASRAPSLLQQVLARVVGQEIALQ